MSAAVFRFVSFVGLAIVAAGLWVAVFRSTGGTVTATPAIPRVGSESIFAPAAQPRSSLDVSGVVRKGDCSNCAVHVGSGGLVRAEVPSGAGRRTAYALLDVGNIATTGQVLVHDVIGFGRGQTPARRVRLLQALDAKHQVIFELVAGPDRRLYLTSPARGLRATPLTLATGAVVPNDGISGVAIDVAVKPNEWVRISVNGMRTVSRTLAGGKAGPPRFLAAGVIGYKAPPHAPAITATHAQVSVSTSAAPAATVSAPTAQLVPAVQAGGPTAPPLSSLTPPTISGRLVVGATLTAAPGSWSDGGATFTYAWERCAPNGSCSSIDRAQSATYQLVPADTDAFVRVRVTAHAGDADVSSTSIPMGPVAPAPPSVLTEPSISGNTVVGATLVADPGSWSDPNATFSFSWQRCDDRGICRTIDGAVGATYLVSADDLGSVLVVEVSAANAGGQNEANSSPTGVVVFAAPEVVTAPSLSGDGTVGSTLTADPGTWSDPAATLTDNWLRCHSLGSGSCSTIDGATGTTYTLTSDDEGYRIEFEVTATNPGGSATADSNQIGPVVPAPPVLVTAPSLSGDATVGSTLTADPGTWNDPAATLTYSWLRCDSSGGSCSAIDGADGTTYTLTEDDLDSSIRVEVTATNAAGTATADSTPTDPIGPAPPGDPQPVAGDSSVAGESRSTRR
jgi:hypothetical protein